MQHVEHLGIAVPDLEAATETFAKLLNRQPDKTEAVEREGVSTVFFELGQTKLELLGATREDSPIAKYTAKKGAGIHHVAIEVADIHAEMQRLAEAGFELLNDEPKPGADNKLICFLHPKSTAGILVELTMTRPAD